MNKRIIISILCFISILSSSALAQEKDTQKTKVKMEQLTYDKFLDKIWDFEFNPEAFTYKGELPAVIDFYANWCGPCRRIAPIIEKLAAEYQGQIIVYKVNTDQQRKLANVFKIKSIPTLLFIPTSGQPSMQAGALSEEQYRNIIEEQLLK